MLLRLFSHARMLFPLLSVCVLVALLSALDANAEGVLPSRQRHRAQALIAARQHFKRQFSNETTTDSSSASLDSTKSSSSSTTGSSESPLSFVKSLLNGTSETTALESNTATGVLAPPVFVSATASDSTDPTSVATSTTPASVTDSTTTSASVDQATTSTDTSSKASTDSSSASVATETDTSSTSRTSLALPAVTTDSTSSVSSAASSVTPSLTSTSSATSADLSSTDSPASTSDASPQSSTASSDVSASISTVASSTNTFEPTGTSQTVLASTDIVPTTTSTTPDTSFSSLSPTATTSNSEIVTSIPATSQIFATPSANSTESTAVQTGLSSSPTDSRITDSATLAPTSTSAENKNTTIAGPTADVLPTSSSSQTAWLPTALIIASPSPTTSELVTAVGPTPSAQSTEAPSVPKIVTPADGIPVSPANSTLVRIGFLESLNYPFVVQHSVTVAQIFQVLPIAIAYALQVPASYVVTRSLQPYPLSEYTATVAMVWIPQDQYDTLRVAILAVNSRLYDQPDPTAEQLVKLINPTIPLLADGAPGNGGSGSSAGAPATDGSPNLSNSGSISGSLDNVDGQPDPSSTTSTPKQVGIGIGAAVAALGYVALVFYGAKRFRRQSTQAENDRRGHARVSSITGERPSSAPFAQSYRSSRTSSNRAVRGQNISAPLMTANSLLLQ